MPKSNPRKVSARASTAPYLNPLTFTDDEPPVVIAEPVDVDVPREMVPSAPGSDLPPGVIDPEILAPVLLGQPDGSPARKLLDMIYGKWAGGKPLAFYCDEAGLEFDELIGMVEKHYGGLARINASKHFVQIFEDTAVDAKARVGACDKCFKTGWAHVEIDGILAQTNKVCPYCEGTGHRRYPGDRHARAVMFEAMGIVGKARQPLVAIQQNISVGSEQASRVGFTQKMLAAGRGKG